MARPSKYEKVFAHKLLTDDEASAILSRALTILNEHFDTIVICATCMGPDKTEMHTMQVGNDYAVTAMLEEASLRSRPCTDDEEEAED